MEQTDLLTVARIAQNPALVIERVNLVKAGSSEEILVRPLRHTDVDGLQQFFNSLSEATRKRAAYPAYDLQYAQQLCDETDDDENLRMVSTSADEKIIGLFELDLDLEEFDIDRYRKYGVELNKDSDIQLAACIVDEYQNQNLGSKLLRLTIDLAKRLGKKRVILLAGVLTDNKQGIRFYQKNHFQIFQEKYTAVDGYECYDGILQLN